MFIFTFYVTIYDLTYRINFVTIFAKNPAKICEIFRLITTGRTRGY